MGWEGRFDAMGACDGIGCVAARAKVNFSGLLSVARASELPRAARVVAS